MKTARTLLTLAVSAATLMGIAPTTQAQATVDSRHEIPWNRYYDVEETYAHMRALADADPELSEIQPIGASGQGRELLGAVMTAPGDDHTK